MNSLPCLWAMGLALVLAGGGCDDEDVPGADAGIDAARMVDAAKADSASLPDMAIGMPDAGLADVAATDAVSTDGPAGDATGDGAVDATTDVAPADAPVVVDGPPVDMMPDTSLPPDTMPVLVEPDSCAEVNCPALFAVANQCNPSSDSCTYDVTAEGPPRITSYCLAGGIKKISTSTFSGEDYATTMEAKKSDGSACYTLLINGTPQGEALTWRDPAGVQLATGTWKADSGQLIFTCGNVSYDVTGLGCPASDTEPSPNDCSEGTCSP